MYGIICIQVLYVESSVVIEYNNTVAIETKFIMNIQDLHTLWEADSKIDRTELGEESLRIPQLHAKYFRLYSDERRVLRQWEQSYKRLYRQKHEYYNGTLSLEELKENAWDPFALRILKSDISVYIDADEHLMKARSMIAQQQEKVEFLESIIKNLPSRGYQIKSAIDWEKFRNGL